MNSSMIVKNCKHNLPSKACNILLQAYRPFIKYHKIYQAFYTNVEKN